MIKCVCALVFSVLWVLPEMLVAAPPQKQEVLAAYLDGKSSRNILTPGNQHL